MSVAHPVYPAPMPAPVHATNGEAPLSGDYMLADPLYEFVLNEKTYSDDAFYPSEAVEVVKIGWARDHYVARVAFRPIRYNPMRGELQVTRQLVVEVRFESNGNVSALEVPSEPSPVFEPLFDDVLLNYETAHSWQARPSLSLCMAV